jgi:hypothetical protein
MDVESPKEETAQYVESLRNVLTLRKNVNIS